MTWPKRGEFCSYDDRTLRRHIETAWKMMREAECRLTHVLGGLHVTVAPREEESSLEERQQREGLLTEAAATATPEAAEGTCLAPIEVLHAVYELARGRNSRQNSSALGTACSAPPVHDTS